MNNLLPQCLLKQLFTFKKSSFLFMLSVKRSFIFLIFSEAFLSVSISHLHTVMTMSLINDENESFYHMICFGDELRETTDARL